MKLLQNYTFFKCEVSSRVYFFIFSAFCVSLTFAKELVLKEQTVLFGVQTPTCENL
jgi:hypothetical protein